MKITAIYYSSRFYKNLAKLSGEEIKKLSKVESIFQKDCFDKRLKTHKLKGHLKDYWAFSVTYSVRIMFKFLKEGAVVFIDIGTHSIYE